MKNHVQTYKESADVKHKQIIVLALFDKHVLCLQTTQHVTMLQSSPVRTAGVSIETGHVMAMMIVTTAM